MDESSSARRSSRLNNSNTSTPPTPASGRTTRSSLRRSSPDGSKGSSDTTSSAERPANRQLPKQSTDTPCCSKTVKEEQPDSPDKVFAASCTRYHPCRAARRGGTKEQIADDHRSHAEALQKLQGVFTIYKVIALKDRGGRPIHQPFLYRNHLLWRNRSFYDKKSDNYAFGEEDPPRALRARSKYPQPAAETFQVKRDRLIKLVAVIKTRPSIQNFVSEKLLWTSYNFGAGDLLKYLETDSTAELRKIRKFRDWFRSESSGTVNGRSLSFTPPLMVDILPPQHTVTISRVFSQTEEIQKELKVEAYLVRRADTEDFGKPEPFVGGPFKVTNKDGDLCVPVEIELPNIAQTRTHDMSEVWLAILVGSPSIPASNWGWPLQHVDNSTLKDNSVLIGATKLYEMKKGYCSLNEVHRIPLFPFFKDGEPRDFDYDCVLFESPHKESSYGDVELLMFEQKENSPLREDLERSGNLKHEQPSNEEDMDVSERSHIDDQNQNMGEVKDSESVVPESNDKNGSNCEDMEQSETDSDDPSPPKRTRRSCAAATVEKIKASCSVGVSTSRPLVMRSSKCSSVESNGSSTQERFGDWTEYLESFLADRQSQPVGGKYVANVRTLQKLLGFIKPSSLASSLKMLEYPLRDFVQPDFPAKLHYNLFAGYGKDMKVLREQLMSETAAERNERRAKMDRLFMNFEKSYALLQTDQPDLCLVCDKKMPNLFSLLCHYRIHHSRLVFKIQMDYASEDEFLSVEYPEIDVYLNEDFRDESELLVPRRSAGGGPTRTPCVDNFSLEWALEGWQTSTFRQELLMDNLLFAVEPREQRNGDLSTRRTFVKTWQHLLSAESQEDWYFEYTLRMLYDYRDVEHRILVFAKFWNRFAFRIKLSTYYPNKTFLFLAFKLFFISHRKLITKFSMSLELLTMYNKFHSDDVVWKIQFQELLHMYSLTYEQLQEYLLPIHSLRDANSPMHRYMLQLGRESYANSHPVPGYPATYSDNYYVFRGYNDRPNDCPMRISASNPCRYFFKTDTIPDTIYPPQWVIDFPLPNK